MPIKISELPEGLKMLALMEQESSGNAPNENIELSESVPKGGFSWIDSLQGFFFWERIYRKYLGK